VAAVTYYVVGLIGHAAEALGETGLPVHPDLVMGISIPIVAGVAGLGLHRIRRAVTRSRGEQAER
jgi:uncharacterized membrane-anchored protein